MRERHQHHIIKILVCTLFFFTITIPSQIDEHEEVSQPFLEQNPETDVTSTSLLDPSENEETI